MERAIAKIALPAFRISDTFFVVITISLPNCARAIALCVPGTTILAVVNYAVVRGERVQTNEGVGQDGDDVHFVRAVLAARTKRGAGAVNIGRALDVPKPAFRTNFGARARFIDRTRDVAKLSTGTDTRALASVL